MLLKFYDVNLTFGIHGESFTFIMLKENNGKEFHILYFIECRWFEGLCSTILITTSRKEVHFIGYSVKTSNIV